jgi:multidrug efflux pump subunit AcrA (membrane-fusion protein)
MASKAIYSITAVVGIAAASGAAWWYQSKPKGPLEIGVSSGAANNPASTASAPAVAASAPRPAGVEVAKVERMALQDDAQSVGSLRSRQSVMLRPEVPGRIKQLGFADGQRVRKGQVLVQLDDVLQRAEIKQARAQVSIAQANLKRNQELVAQNFVAQRVLEETAANLQVAEAQLALSCARLSRMAILAPFDGTVGIRNVNIGDFVKDGADLINLEDIGSMYVDFRLPERFQGKLRLQQSVDLTLDALPGRTFKARVEAIDPLLDVNGRSVGVRAILPNTMGEPARDSGRGGPGGPGAGAGAGNRPGGQGASGTPATGRPSPAVAQVGPGGRPGAGAGVVAGGGAGRPGMGRPGGAPNASGPAPAVDADGCAIDASTVAANAASGAAPGGAGQSPNRGPAAGAGRPGVVAGGPSGPGGAPRGAGPGGAAGGNPSPLRPGMFARVNTVFSINDAALVVPEESIVPQGGRQFVVKAVTPDQVASVDKSKLPEEVKFVSLRQEVRLGIRRAGKVEVLSGLDEGQSVVVAGHQRLQRDGTPLRVIELGRPPGGGGQGGGQGGPIGPSGSGGASGSGVPAPGASAPLAQGATAPGR